MAVEFPVDVIMNDVSLDADADIYVPGVEITDYATLANKPSINGNVLIGDKSTADLGIDHVPLADNLVANSGITSASPYLFRKSPQNVSAELHRLIGGTVAWNQLYTNTGTGTSNGITITRNSDGSCTLNGTATANSAVDFMPVKTVNGNLIEGHVYFLRGCPTGGGSSTYYVGIAGLLIDSGSGGVYKHSGFNSSAFRFDFKSGQTFNNVKVWPQYVDVTALLGATVADALYNMGADGLALYKQMFPSIYPYSASTLQSVQTSARVTRGFNQWDEEWEQGYYNAEGNPASSTTTIRSKNYIPVLPNTTYYAKASASIYICQYDGNKNFLGTRTDYSNLTFTTLPGAQYIRFNLGTAYGATYLHDICINLSDTARNGQYQPYSAKSYPIDDVVLRGIPKLTNGVLSYDGDIYLPNGEVTRRYSNVVDLGDYVWTKTTISSQTVFYANLTGGKKSTPFNGVCTAYPVSDTGIALTDKTAWLYGGSSFSRIAIRDDAYNDSTESAFRTAMTGKKLVYELLTPTTEQADPYAEIQTAGETEQFVSESPVPVGNEAFYPEDITGVVQNLAPLPTTAGTYKLQVTVSGGVPSYSWVAG